MFENRENLISQLKTPLNISLMALDEIEQRLGGNKVIADPNTPFCHLLEFGSSLCSNAITAIDEKFPLIYPARATSMNDLFHHMSDYDYLRMESTPASALVIMGFPKKYLIDNAKLYNTNYRKITIPKDTVFLVGRYHFGLYYPIDILINEYTNAFTVLYDTTNSNPLHQLTQNVVEKYNWNYGGLEYLIIRFPIYQFAKSSKEESCIAETGFHQSLMYNNRFYAIRIYTFKEGKYEEFRQTYSHIVYDASTPTAYVQVLPDQQTLKVKVPQVYFDRGMMGSKILTEVYTTMGAIDVDTASISASSVQANFSLQSKDTTPYSAILSNFPYDLILSLDSAKITGGSNAIDVKTLRDRVVNDTMYEKVPITEGDMKVYLQDNSFYLKKYLDNVTDRVYHAYRILEDGSGGIIPSLTLKMEMKAKYADDDSYTGFLKQSDNSITVLPTTIYKYIEEAGDAIPLTKEECLEFTVVDKQQLARMLNSGQYLRSPFHLRFDLNDTWPKCTTYDLFTPNVEKIIFECENFNLPFRMMSFGALVEHLEQGTGGYDVIMQVFLSDDLADIDPDDLLIYVAVRSSDGYWIGNTAEFSHATDTQIFYKFHIDTRYHISANDEIGVTNFQNNNFALYENMVKLEQDWHLIYMIKRDKVTGEFEEAEQRLTLGVPDKYLESYIAMVRQYMTLNLGQNLGKVVKNDIDITTLAQKYKTYNHDVPRTYTEDEYGRDGQGALLFDKNLDGKYYFAKQHEIGEEMLDERGLKIYAHKTGDVIYNGGQPEILYDREKVFYTDVMFIDAKVYASERPVDIEFTNKLPSMLNTYFDVVRHLQDNLLERTHIYFRCIKSTGTALFNMGDGITTRQNLEMSFRIGCYVPSYVKKQESIQQEIEEKICSAIEAAIKTKTISMLDIFERVKDQMSDYIDHFTLLGINGIESNQTFVIVDEDAQPSVKHELVVDADNILKLRKSILISFIALEDNTASISSVDS